MENTEGNKSNAAIGSAILNSAPKISSDTEVNKIPNLAGNAENGTSTSTVTMSVENQTGANETKESQCEIEETEPRESSFTVDVRKMEKDSLVEQKPIENKIDVANTVEDIPDQNINEKKVDSSTNLSKEPIPGTGNLTDPHRKNESESITMKKTEVAISTATSKDVVSKSIEKILSAAEKVDMSNSEKKREVSLSAASQMEAQENKNKHSDKSTEAEISTASQMEAQENKNKHSDKSMEAEISTASQMEAQENKNKHVIPEESDRPEAEKSDDKNEKKNNENNQETNGHTLASSEKKFSDTVNSTSVEAIPVEETNMDDEEVVVVAEVVTEECDAMMPEKSDFDSSQVEKMTNEPMDVDTPVESGIPSKEKEVAASDNATTVSKSEKVKDTSLSQETMLIDKVDKGLLTQPESNFTRTAIDKTESNLAQVAEQLGDKSAKDIPVTEKTKSTKEKTSEMKPNKIGKDKPPYSSGCSSKSSETQAEEKSNKVKTKTPKLSEDAEKSKTSQKSLKLTIAQKKRLDDARTRLINSKTYWKQIEVDDARLVGWEAHQCLREDKKHIDRYWLTRTGFRLRSRPEIERFLSYMAIMNDNEDEAFALLKGKASGIKTPPKKISPKKTSPRKKIAASPKKTSSEAKKTEKPNKKRTDASIPVKTSTKRKNDETAKERKTKKAKTKKSKTTSHEVVEMTTAVSQTLMRRLAKGTQKIEVAEQKSIPSFQMHREFSKKKAAKTSAPRVMQQKSHKSGLPNLADGKE